MAISPPRRRSDLEDAPPVAPDDVSITGSRRSQEDSVEGRTPDPDTEEDVAVETYEERVDRAVSESLAEHPEGSAPALERAVESRRDDET